MQNKIKILYITFFFIFLSCVVSANDQFSFNVTEIEILENGNKIVASKRGLITSDNGITINADNFEYNRTSNILNASGNVVVEHSAKNYLIYTDEITFFKNDNIITSQNNTKIIDNEERIINSRNFLYNVNDNIFKASKNVKVIDVLNNYVIISDDITYFKNDENIISNGKTNSSINSRYELQSEDISYSFKTKIVSSKNKTSLKDKQTKTAYEITNFSLSLTEEILKGENITINTNYNLPYNDRYFIKSGIFDLKNQTFFTQNIDINLKKNTFNNEENDPRIKGISSSSQNGITTINKGIFTSCKKNENCTPWTIQADKIEYDKNKKIIKYDHALLKVYNTPIFYFPKFFHPGPTIKRQSGFLAPGLSNSNTLGSSLKIPYFWAPSKNKDFTFTPSIYSKNIYRFQNEYRQKNKDSSFIADLGFVDGYKSKNSKEKNSISHFFSKYNSNLKFENFKDSTLDISIEKVNNDTYLKIFDQSNLDKKLKPQNNDVLKSEIKFNLINEEYELQTGLISYENLQKNKADRYEFILPYYNFSTELNKNGKIGNLNFISIGDNILKDTNNLRSRIINNFDFKGFDIISNGGFQNNFNFYIRNLTASRKNDPEYKSNVNNDLMGIFEFQSSLPMAKVKESFVSFLKPKISLRTNPSSMKNNYLENRTINYNNIFDINRLGFDDTLESGSSLTMGIDFKKESLQDINKYFEFKLGTIIRDKNNNNIPLASGITKKRSNYFGNINNNFNENIDINYDFSINSDLDKLEYNSLGLGYKNDTFRTRFNFIEESGVIGSSNILENKTSLILNENNNLLFETRQNRKINLTEYYNLIYEYKNDCLVAGITYNKTYYEDRDLQPSENLMFKLTLIPITSIGQSIKN